MRKSRFRYHRHFVESVSGSKTVQERFNHLQNYTFSLKEEWQWFTDLTTVSALSNLYRLNKA